MKNIFRNYYQAKDKICDAVNEGAGVTNATYTFAESNYNSIKNMVSEVEKELLKQNGSIDGRSEEILIRSISRVCGLIEGKLESLPLDTKQEAIASLLELLFYKVEDLISMCEETDNESNDNYPQATVMIYNPKDK